MNNTKSIELYSPLGSPSVVSGETNFGVIFESEDEVCAEGEDIANDIHPVSNPYTIQGQQTINQAVGATRPVHWLVYPL